MSTTKIEKKPHVPRELLQWLTAKFPDRAPDITDTDRQVWVNVGHIEVVRHLRKIFDEQEG